MTPLTIVNSTGEHNYQVELAETSQQQSIGMQHRTEVPPGTGMYFPRPAPYRSVYFWMRDTFVPLDMIFVSPLGRVQKIVTRTDLDSDKATGSGGKVMGVLELAAGEGARMRLKVGDRVIVGE